MASSSESLVDVIRKAQLVPEEQVEQLKKLQGRFTTPRALAEELVRRSWLSPYQVNLIFQGRANELVLGPHRLMERLGEGGSGQVFKAFHETLNCVVAVKILRKDVQSDADTVNRFHREIEVAKRVSHPNIVHTYEAGAVGSTLVLTMEYVDGIDLERLVEESGPLPTGQACDYIRQAALGLQHAHDRGLVHRDVKPSNLLVTPKPKPRHSGFGVVKILDLGLARLLYPGQESATRNLTILAGNSIMIGTPDYMAPEQALDLHSADVRADVYSLGCTLYFMLTGQPPFGGGSLTQKLMRHQQSESPSVTRLRPDVPPEIDDMIGRMLAKRPKDRYQTAAEVAETAARLQTASKGSVPASGPPLRQHSARTGPGTLKLLGEKLTRLPRKVYLSLGAMFIALLLWWAIPSPGDGPGSGQRTGDIQVNKATTAPAAKSRVLVFQGREYVRDAILDPAQPARNFGSVPSDNRLAKYEPSSVFLTRFDLDHLGVPSNVKVVRATVSFYVWDPHGDALTKVCAYTMKTSWHEGIACWQRPAPGRTWQRGVFALGVDTSPEVSQVIVRPNPTTDTVDPPVEYQLDVTSMARAWLNDGAPNHGLAIAPVSDRAVDDGRRSRFQIRASEYRNARYTPKLTLALEY